MQKKATSDDFRIISSVPIAKAGLLSKFLLSGGN